jgi:hypothetical protein
MKYRTFIILVSNIFQYVVTKRILLIETAIGKTNQEGHKKVVEPRRPIWVTQGFHWTFVAFCYLAVNYVALGEQSVSVASAWVEGVGQSKILGSYVLPLSQASVTSF